MFQRKITAGHAPHTSSKSCLKAFLLSGEQSHHANKMSLSLPAYQPNEPVKDRLERQKSRPQIRLDSERSQSLSVSLKVIPGEV